MIWAVSLLTIDLSTYSLIVIIVFIRIRSLVKVGITLGYPNLSSALPQMIN
jgi:hypothetical protein